MLLGVDLVVAPPVSMEMTSAMWASGSGVASTACTNSMSMVDLMEEAFERASSTRLSRAA